MIVHERTWTQLGEPMCWSSACIPFSSQGFSYRRCAFLCTLCNRIQKRKGKTARKRMMIRPCMGWCIMKINHINSHKTQHHIQTPESHLENYSFACCSVDPSLYILYQILPDIIRMCQIYQRLPLIWSRMEERKRRTRRRMIRRHMGWSIMKKTPINSHKSQPITTPYPNTRKSSGEL